MPKIKYADGSALADAYPTTPKEVYLINIDKAIIYIKNTHATKGLKYKILAYPDRDDKTVEESLVGETVLAAGGTVKQSITDPYDAITIPMKNENAGDNTTVKAWVNLKPINQ